MAEPLKNMYTEEFLRLFGERVQAAYSPFDIDGFIHQVMDKKWGELELKERIRRISLTLGRFCPVVMKKLFLYYLPLMSTVADFRTCFSLIS